ncbi:MAG: DUF4388 domain-containing protein [Planctomycetota bacterium]|nr:DUF4388 domain-containing protein [Planctomycetota bacterium]
MVLKGELGDVRLADLFQMLAATSVGGTGGTLIITSEKRKIHIYFGEGRIRLLREGGVSHTALGTLLLRTGRITQAQLAEALKKQQQTGALLGETLVTLGYVNENDINDCVRTQLEEEICSVFLWENAHFEFIPGPPSAPFVDSSLLGKEIPFEANELLLEATRRVDEWSKMLEEIERTRAKFKVMTKELPSSEPLLVGLSYEDIRRIVELIEQVQQIEEVIGRAPLSKLEVARVLAFLLRSGYIQKIEPTEEKPKKELPELDWRTALSFDAADPQVKEKLKEICHKTASKEEAINEILSFADEMQLSGRVDDAVAVYQSLLDLEPDNSTIRTKIVHAYLSRWRFAEAAKVLVEGYRRQMKPKSK